MADHKTIQRAWRPVLRKTTGLETRPTEDDGPGDPSYGRQRAWRPVPRNATTLENPPCPARPNNSATTPCESGGRASRPSTRSDWFADRSASSATGEPSKPTQPNRQRRPPMADQTNNGPGDRPTEDNGPETRPRRHGPETCPTKTRAWRPSHECNNPENPPCPARPNNSATTPNLAGGRRGRRLQRLRRSFRVEGRRLRVGDASIELRSDWANRRCRGGKGRCAGMAAAVEAIFGDDLLAREAGQPAGSTCRRVARPLGANPPSSGQAGGRQRTDPAGVAERGENPRSCRKPPGRATSASA